MAQAPADKPVIGIVGGVGAGKSTVAAEFARLGCAVIDADRIGHEVLREPQVRDALHELWGDDVLDADGQVRRSAVAAVVFGDPQALQALQRITHPRIRERMERQIAAARADATVPAAVLDAVVLFEAGADDLCTHVIFVQAPDAARAERVRRGRGWDRREWRRREKAQFPLDKKLQRCYAVVDNSSSVSHLREQVRELLRRICPAEDHP